MDLLDDIQTALNPLKKKSEKLKLIFMTILGQAESFKNESVQCGPTQPDRNGLCRTVSRKVLKIFVCIYIHIF